MSDHKSQMTTSFNLFERATIMNGECPMTILIICVLHEGMAKFSNFNKFQYILKKIRKRQPAAKFMKCRSRGWPAQIFFSPFFSHGYDDDRCAMTEKWH